MVDGTTQACPMPAIELSSETTGLYQVSKYDAQGLREVQDCVAEEVPIAMIYNGISHAVMLASPADLEDFALGFSLAEGIIDNAQQLYDVEIVHQPNGIELQVHIDSECFVKLKDRRRSMTGRTGCGLCGAESLQQALRLPQNTVEQDSMFALMAVQKALQALQSLQLMQQKTGATHASAWANMAGEVLLIREDVGRHNALDKLLGARARQLKQASPSVDLAAGFVMTTSRASYEMVQKVAVAGVPMLVAISAPTGLAIKIAQNCGISLLGFARSQQCVIYSGGHRVVYP
jgi:FdhD protein